MDAAGELTFAAVDDMAFGGITGGHSSTAKELEVRQIGPLVEFAFLCDQGGLRSMDIEGVDQASALWSITSWCHRNVVVELSGKTGFMRLGSQAVAEAELVKLLMVAKRVGLAAGFSDRSAGQLSAALSELLSNIIEHSQASDTGLVAYQALDGCFEFVAADQGVGALQSLRSNERFSLLRSDQEALPLVLRGGCSRFSDPKRGHGFDDLFRGLANHNGRLRFRSGEAAVLIDGNDPSAIKAKVKKRAHFQGFFASICCSP